MTTSDAKNEAADGRGTEGSAEAERRASSRSTKSAASAEARATAKAAGGDGRPGGAEGSDGAEAGALSFEESTRRLAKIVADLEGGDLPLERALELFEEGIRLSRSAQERLDRAEKRVEELLGIDADGRPITREFEG